MATLNFFKELQLNLQPKLQLPLQIQLQLQTKRAQRMQDARNRGASVIEREGSPTASHRLASSAEESARVATATRKQVVSDHIQSCWN